MDPFSFLTRVLALHHPTVDTAPSSSPTSTSPQQQPHRPHHPTPSSAAATAAHAAVLKLASEVLSQEPGLLEGAVEVRTEGGRQGGMGMGRRLAVSESLLVAHRALPSQNRHWTGPRCVALPRGSTDGSCIW